MAHDQSCLLISKRPGRGGHPDLVACLTLFGRFTSSHSTRTSVKASWHDLKGTWSTTGNLVTARELHTATLLPSGKVLVAGGLGSSGGLNSAELYDQGLGFDPSWQPLLTTVSPSPLLSGSALTASGSRFKGISEASGGNGTQNSSSNYPVVQLLSLANEQTLFLPVDAVTGWSDTSFTSTPITIMTTTSSGFPIGYALVTVFTNGIPSQSQFVVGTATPPVCPQPQGYWKNNPNAWPVNSLTLGSQTYTKTELLRILRTSVGTGPRADASLILADQLIAAKLNIANGLPIWRRALVWTINKSPILRALAQCFANRIHEDVAGFLFQFVMIAQPVIEKIALPTHAMFSGDELLPILDGCCHSRFTRERDDCVQMIRHKQTQAAMPDESLVIEFHGIEHGVASVCAASWFLPGGTQLIVIKNQLPSATHCGIV